MKYLILISTLFFIGCSQTTIYGTGCKVHKFNRMSCDRYDIIQESNVKLIKD